MKKTYYVQKNVGWAYLPNIVNFIGAKLVGQANWNITKQNIAITYKNLPDK